MPPISRPGYAYMGAAAGAGLKGFEYVEVAGYCIVAPHSLYHPTIWTSKFEICFFKKSNI
jgi:hypothetical protein